jgi:dGTPase
MMNWTNIVSGKRTGKDSSGEGIRTEYQRDYDRLIFSSGFRRLQNKTQVFPLPGSTFVHNRLTHSLEVASVGRSLGKRVGEKIADLPELENKPEHKNFYRFELPNVIAAACLAHDIGNPAFGHSGEKAISNYFKESGEKTIDGKRLKDFFSTEEWQDLISFEGNANALRILTHQFNGKSTGGHRLTYTTLASILKYPCGSISVSKKEGKHRSKYGFFQSEKEIAVQIAKELNMIQESEEPPVFKRHPFVYLTEAADDICYRIIDFEDAHRLGILDARTVIEHFVELFGAMQAEKFDPQRTQHILDSIGDPNEKISYLRAMCINALIFKAADVFIQHSEEIIQGGFNNGLVDFLEKEYPVLEKIQKISIEKIYNHETVVQIEIAGYHVMSELLSLLVPAALKSEKDHKDEKIMKLIPSQFHTDGKKPYNKVLSVLDYVSGMTDPYATELYKKVFGFEIPKHR